MKSNNSANDKFNLAVFDKNSIILEDIENELSKWLDRKNLMNNDNSCCYYHILPMILAEEFLSMDNQEELIDYKFVCVKGEVLFIYVVSRIQANNGRQKIETFYSKNWERLEVRYSNRGEGNYQKPQNLSKMIEIAEKLSAEFPMVRVDFYDLKDKIMIGELTFDPAGGMLSFTPDKFDYEMGKHFVLPKANVKLNWIQKSWYNE